MKMTEKTIHIYFKNSPNQNHLCDICDEHDLLLNELQVFSVHNDLIGQHYQQFSLLMVQMNHVCK